jgi:hypothetical protein
MREIINWVTSERVVVHAPAVLAAMVVAELFYKFHSFTLECIAFLATWYLIHLPITAVYRRLNPGLERG